MEKTWYKVYVPINDEKGNVVDYFREDWHENDSPEAAGKRGYLMACEETWGENNEFLPSPDNIEVYNDMGDNVIIMSVDVILSNFKIAKEKRMNTKALKLYGENVGFCRMVNINCGFIEAVQPEIYETEDELFNIALERTYDHYLKTLGRKEMITN